MDSKVLITVGRQIGSGGLQVARMVAEKLGVEVYDKNLLMLTARDCGIAPEFFAKRDEKPSALGRFARFLGLRGTMYGDTGAYSDNGVLSGDDLFALQSKVISQIADSGSGIFVGRCADYVLRDRPELFSVFITADDDYRIGKVMERENLTAAEARKFIESEERKRASYYNYYTFKKWGDGASYDLCLNTTRFGLERSADLIVEMYRQRQ
ncbi:MAG: cytidylate kinase-like family protein [Bacteroidales bacterium]|nr:cytidylate kinase-like family protein [Bacteroidales bacterium]